MNNYETLVRVSKHIHGHTKAKKILINLVNRALLRCEQRWGSHIKDSNAITNQNCMIIGKSGTGKTYLIEQLAEVMDFHFVRIDATSLAPMSASGETKTDVLKTVKNSAERYFKCAMQGKYSCVQEVLDQTIVFVDEIDKLARSFDGGSGNWNKHTQANFLTVFENKAAGFENLSWVFAGAFTSLLNKTKKTSPIGFYTLEAKEVPEKDIETDIINFGLIPELIGRIHHIVELDELTKEDYRHILTNIIIPKRIKQLSFTSIDYNILEELNIEQIVDKAFKSEQGVRSMVKSIDNFLIDIEFHEAPPFKLQYLPDTEKPGAQAMASIAERE